MNWRILRSAGLTADDVIQIAFGYGLFTGGFGLHYGAERLRVTISIGVALYPRHARNFTGLYKAADMALYRVKELGRSGSRVHGDDGELSEQACLELDVLKVPSGLA